MKIIRNILICLYGVITIVVTFCLLSYNEYNVAEFKDKYLLVFEDKENNIDKSSLLVIDKDDYYDVDEFVFYYDSIVKLNKVIDKEDDYGKTVYTLEDGIRIDKELILGSINNMKSYFILGSIYSGLTSKWGYLVIVIFPILVAFIYEIYQIIKELRK